MRILFINTFEHRGGAAVVATRLATSLEKEFGHEVYFLVGNKTSSRRNIFKTRGVVGKFIEKVIDRVFNRIGLQYQFFPFSSTAILRHVKRIKPDVISLHNTHGGYFETPLLRRISMHAPIVWTLHDMWSFTGNSAHTFGDTSWMNMESPRHLTKIYPEIGVNKGAFLLRQKKKIYERSALAVVTPSRWLYEMAKQSPVFERINIEQIYNGLDTTIFDVHDKQLCRAELNIPNNSRVIMFSSDFLKNNQWKGGKDLTTVLQKMSSATKMPIHLLIAGSGDLEGVTNLPNFVVHKTGYINDELQMAKCLAASDIFLYPTKADNLPNVLIEAQACGVPCITFDIGGCREIVVDRETGYIVPPFDVEQMAARALQLLDNASSQMTASARAHAVKKFDSQVMAIQYDSLFRKQIAEFKNN